MQAKAKKLNYKLFDDAAVSLSYVSKIAAATFKKRDSLRNDIQKALVACCYHAWKHGDWTIVLKLCNPELPTSEQHDGNSKIVKWVCKYIGLEVLEVVKMTEKGEKKFLQFGNWKGREYVESMFNSTNTSLGAKDCMWYGYKESTIAPYNVNDAIRAFVKTHRAKAAKAATDPKVAAVCVLAIDKECRKLLAMEAGFKFDEAGNIIAEAA